MTPLPSNVGEIRKKSEPIALVGLNRINEVPRDSEKASALGSVPSPTTLLEL